MRKPSTKSAAIASIGATIVAGLVAVLLAKRRARILHPDLTPPEDERGFL